MYEIMAETTPELLAIRVSGKLSEADYKGLHPWLDERLVEHPCPSMLIVMEDFKGWETIGALLEDAKIDMAHHDDLRRIAMVGDRAWQKWMTLITVPFMKTEVKYSGLDKLAAARAWAKQGNESRKGSRGQ